MATIYVSKAGSDSNNGTSVSTPLLTVGKANGNSSPVASTSDTTYIAPGVYSELLTLGMGGASGSPLQIIGDGDGAGFRAGGYSDALTGAVEIRGWTDGVTPMTTGPVLSANGKSYVAIRNVKMIGGAAGSFPPMVAWAAVTGGISLESIVLFAIIFLWTPPHFWALALYKQGDYQEAGIPMMPNVVGEASTKLQILVYSVLLVAVTLVPPFIGFGGMFYATVAAVSGLWFVVLAARLYRLSGVEMKKAGRRLFTYSLYYLAVIFLALLAGDFLVRFGGW